jgi:hypothetical protein
LKNYLIVSLSILATSCVAPRCPEQACHVKYEHIHENKAYRGVSYLKAKKRYPWTKDEKYTKDETADGSEKGGIFKKKKKKSNSI